MERVQEAGAFGTCGAYSAVGLEDLERVMSDCSDKEKSQSRAATSTG